MSQNGYPTKGPYYVSHGTGDEEKYLYHTDIDQPLNLVATVHFQCDDWGEQTAANANLLAAAPDMREALETVGNLISAYQDAHPDRAAEWRLAVRTIDRALLVARHGHKLPTPEQYRLKLRERLGMEG